MQNNQLSPITITLNGESHQMPSGLSITALLAQLSLTEKRLAIEKNGEIVVRSEYTTSKIDDNDVIEIIRAIGGG